VSERERDQTDTGQCKDCQFSGWYMARTHFRTLKFTAECRRWPPLGGHKKWSTVGRYDGCGEWVARPLSAPPEPTP
jgi:hypothetical protein